jgi:hypothetical protein
MKMRVFLILTMVGLAAQQSQAELLAGTSTNATTVPVAVGNFGLGGDFPVLQARSFFTGGSAYTLESIFFGSHLYHDTGLGGITVSLYSNNGTVPGSAVAGGLNLFSATSATIGNTLLPNSVLTMNANSTYWFVASVDQTLGDTRYWWNLTDSAAFDSDVTGTDLPLGYANSTTDGASWLRQEDLSMQMSIYGTVVPEPGTLSLMGIGMGGTYYARRRRRSKIPAGGFELPEYVRPFIEEETDRVLVDPFC